MSLLIAVAAAPAAAGEVRTFLQLHTVDGLNVDINTDNIVSLRDARPLDQRSVANEINCIVSTTDGKFVSVANTCEEIEHMLGKERTKQ